MWSIYGEEKTDDESRATALLQKSSKGKELTDESEAKLDPIFRMCLGSPAPVNSSVSGTLQV
jgi:hypothetical protein